MPTNRRKMILGYTFMGVLAATLYLVLLGGDKQPPIPREADGIWHEGVIVTVRHYGFSRPTPPDGLSFEVDGIFPDFALHARDVERLVDKIVKGQKVRVLYHPDVILLQPNPNRLLARQSYPDTFLQPMRLVVDGEEVITYAQFLATLSGQ